MVCFHIQDVSLAFSLLKIMMLQKIIVINVACIIFERDIYLQGARDTQQMKLSIQEYEQLE